ncbi:MAG TPA: hypothetical protein VF051_03440 [Hyphomicrobiaceae bacterium]
MNRRAGYWGIDVSDAFGLEACRQIGGGVGFARRDVDHVLAGAQAAFKSGNDGFNRFRAVDAEHDDIGAGGKLRRGFGLVGAELHQLVDGRAVSMCDDGDGIAGPEQALADATAHHAGADEADAFGHVIVSCRGRSETNGWSQACR